METFRYSLLLLITTNLHTLKMKKASVFANGLLYGNFDNHTKMFPFQQTHLLSVSLINVRVTVPCIQCPHYALIWVVYHAPLLPYPATPLRAVHTKIEICCVLRFGREICYLRSNGAICYIFSVTKFPLPVRGGKIFTSKSQNAADFDFGLNGPLSHPVPILQIMTDYRKIYCFEHYPLSG